MLLNKRSALGKQKCDEEICNMASSSKQIRYNRSAWQLAEQCLIKLPLVRLKRHGGGGGPRQATAQTSQKRTPRGHKMGARVGEFPVVLGNSCPRQEGAQNVHFGRSRRTKKGVFSEMVLGNCLVVLGNWPLQKHRVVDLVGELFGRVGEFLGGRYGYPKRGRNVHLQGPDKPSWKLQGPTFFLGSDSIIPVVGQPVLSNLSWKPD